MLNSKKTWVAIIDSYTCKIYEYRKPAQISLLKEILHPENRLRDIELTSDKPGRFKSIGNSYVAYSQPTDPKEIKVEEFSREIAKTLEQGRNTRMYNNLIIIAAPHMNGLLTQQLSKHVKELISNNIVKDAARLSQHQLLHFLEENAVYYY